MRRIEDIKTGEVIHCSTAEESALIWSMLNKIGKAVPQDMWLEREKQYNFKTEYQIGLCYDPRREWCSVKYYEKEGCTIIPAKEFLMCSSTESELLLL